MSLLDHIVHNDCLSNLEFGVIKTNTLYHYATHVHLDITRSQSLRFQQTRATMPFLRDGYHKEKYLNYLMPCMKLSKLEQDVNRLTESLADALTTAVNVFTFKEKMKLAKSNKSLFDKDVKKNKMRQNFAFKRYNRYCTPSNKNKNTKMRNLVCKLLRSKKREYFFDRLTRFLNSSKSFLNGLNRLNGRQKKNSNFITTEIESKWNTEDFAVSTLFNEKFVSESETIAASIPTVPFNTEGLAKNVKSLFLYPTDSLEVSKTVRNLENHRAVGLYGLTAKILKASHYVICDRLTYLVNESLSSGVFPKISKTAKMVPNFECGKKSNCENYRPIPILSVLSKVFERVVFERLYNIM